MPIGSIAQARAFYEEAVIQLRNEIGNSKVMMGFSGGVLSCVTAVLLEKAIGNQLFCVLFDLGLMQNGTAEEARSFVREYCSNELIQVNLELKTMQALDGVESADKKKEITGKILIDAILDEMEDLGDVNYIAQGITREDKKDSGEISLHHGFGGPILLLSRYPILEPTAQLTREEIILVGRILEIPESILLRKSFAPTSYLDRCEGKVSRERIRALRACETIIDEEFKLAGQYPLIDQIQTYMPQHCGTNCSALGKGEQTSEEQEGWTVILRAKNYTEKGIPRFAKIPYPLLEHICSRIRGEVPKVTCVMMDLIS